VKVGYNLRRKVILHSLWAAVPIALYFSPTVFGTFKQPWTDLSTYAEHLARLWLVLAGGALVFRTVHLFFLRGVKTGLVWFTKILTDPFHDVKLYCRAPLHLLRGELVDPMDEVAHQA